MNYKLILRREGITLSEFARKLSVSRPTLYKMLERYDSGLPIGEPNQTVFDAFFLLERDKMKGNYQTRNGNLVCEILENTAENANGTIVLGSETRGKRDIVSARVLIGNANVAEGTVIYFSYYAAQPFSLEGKQVCVVNSADIRFIRKDDAK